MPMTVLASTVPQKFLPKSCRFMSLGIDYLKSTFLSPQHTISISPRNLHIHLKNKNKMRSSILILLSGLALSATATPLYKKLEASDNSKAEGGHLFHGYHGGHKAENAEFCSCEMTRCDSTAKSGTGRSNSLHSFSRVPPEQGGGMDHGDTVAAPHSTAGCPGGT